MNVVMTMDYRHPDGTELKIDVPDDSPFVTIRRVDGLHSPIALPLLGVGATLWFFGYRRVVEIGGPVPDEVRRLAFRFGPEQPST
jgi:hypothetical protein